MIFSNFIATLFFVKVCFTHEIHHVSSNKMRQKLDAAEKNEICCRNNLQCCKRSQETSYFEVKSILKDCIKKSCNYTSSQIVVTRNRSHAPPDQLTECNQKLVLTIKMVNEGVPSEKSQYIIIDHVTDPATMKKIRILNPYAVRIRQEPMMQVYGLHFERAVNAEAQELVHNKHDRNYRGCDVTSDNPTCGAVKHNGKIVPYSRGFCCSCDTEKNSKMENIQEVRWPFAAIPDYNRGLSIKPNYEDHGFIGGAINGADKNINKYPFTGGNYRESRRQRRGGQSCDDIDPNAHPESFHESTHCLKFSNLWYSVYSLEKPKIVHKLKVQIFQKFEDCHGNTHWIDVTKGQVIHLGTSSSTCNNPQSNIIARYSSEDIQNCQQAIDYKKQKLLIPEKRVADPEKFMVVPKDFVSLDGRSCNAAGVGYEAFYKQKKRCSFPQGTCLANQPQHFYDKDVRTEQEGQTGDYFLKFFGTLADDPVTYNATGQIQNLRMIYTERHVSNIFFELNADLVTLLQPSAFATITEVYTDATDIKKTKILVKVTNSGLIYGIFYVRLSGCPLSVPASFNNIASKSVLIPPQHQHVFNLQIEYPLSKKEFFCRIQVHNIYQELIAFREIKIEAYDRCICIWYCECACYVADRGLKCTPLPLESYHSAGFQGGFPFATSVVSNSYLDAMLALFFHMFIYLILTLLGMGFIKAVLGLCSEEIGLWGLETVIGTKDYSSSTVCDNKNCEFRQANSISLPAQFCLNLVFFFIYPLALINIAIKKMCFSSYTLEDDSCSCEEQLIDYEECEDECDEDCNVRRRKSMGEESSAKTISMKYTSSEDKSNKSFVAE